MYLRKYYQTVYFQTNALKTLDVHAVRWITSALNRRKSRWGLNRRKFSYQQCHFLSLFIIFKISSQMNDEKISNGRRIYKNRTYTILDNASCSSLLKFSSRFSVLAIFMYILTWYLNMREIIVWIYWSDIQFYTLT